MKLAFSKFNVVFALIVGEMSQSPIETFGHGAGRRAKGRQYAQYYIYIYIYIHTYICIYIYIYNFFRERALSARFSTDGCSTPSDRKLCTDPPAREGELGRPPLPSIGSMATVLAETVLANLAVYSWCTEGLQNRILVCKHACTPLQAPCGSRRPSRCAERGARG